MGAGIRRANASYAQPEWLMVRLYTPMIACYTRPMSKRTRHFLMHYVRRALLLLADGIKYLCSEDDESAETNVLR